ncbi:SET domain-containing protein [Purpureocillium lavendulum]|uniref:SET domain-containing protein n=1 Tax=Purpureocillium lavendulum TaxID=1247861 RepID=A0AB34FCM0_9HYPO|nr:SET domain-containing protein [Purpureocillium lavendulum]
MSFSPSIASRAAALAAKTNSVSIKLIDEATVALARCSGVFATGLIEDWSKPNTSPSSLLQLRAQFSNWKGVVGGELLGRYA